MAVQSDTSSITYTGNNSTLTSYAVPFVFLENSHLAATAKVTATGVETAVTLTNHTGAGNVNGGTVRTAVAVPATSTLTIFRTVPATQTTTYQEGGDFPAASHERALDKLTMLGQQNARKSDRAIRVTEADGSRTDMVAVANSIIALDASKQPKAMTAQEVKEFLTITGTTLTVNGGMRTFADLTAVNAAVPDYLGQLATRRDTADIYIATGTSAGNWSLVDENLSLADFSSGFFTADSTGRSKFANGFVDATRLASNAVETDKINNSSVTNAKLAFDAGALSGYRNHIINGCFRVAQRGTTFTSIAGANNDDSYNLDRWYVLSDGNDTVDISQEIAGLPTGSSNAIGLDVETVNRKFGIAQIIENNNCAELIGSTVTLSFKARVSSTTKLNNVKAAIIAWSGTPDSVTSDIVSAWNAQGTNPTLIANATYENTPANLNVGTSWSTYTITAPIDTANTRNIIVFIWSDVTDTTLGDFLYVTDVQLENGSVRTPFENRLLQAELDLCYRYCYAVYDFQREIFVGRAISTTGAVGTCFFPKPLRTRATSVVVSGTSFAVYYGNGASVLTTVNPTLWEGGIVAATMGFTVASGLTANAAIAAGMEHSTCRIVWPAEL